MAKVEKLGEIKVSKNGKPFRTLMAGGKCAGWFPKDQNDLTKAQVGDEVELEVNREYTNVKTITFQQVMSQPKEEFISGSEVADQRSMDILKGMALNGACRILGGMGEGKTPRPDAVILYAKALYEEALKQKYFAW